MKGFCMTQKKKFLHSPWKVLQIIPGVGSSIAHDLWLLGIREVSDLVDKVPEEMYAQSCELAGVQIDRCLLYVYRCAVYFAQHSEHDLELLKWWNWKDPSTPTATSGRFVNDTSK
jgi:hypothetical protein